MTQTQTYVPSAMLVFLTIFLAECAFAQNARNPALPPLPPPSASAAAQITPKIDLVKRGLALPAAPKVMVIPVTEETTRWWMIDAWQAAFIRRRINKAEKLGCDLIILDIDTPGGGVAESEQIIKYLRQTDIPSVAFVSGKAFSGGALIALGCQAVVMAPVSQIGGALSVYLFGDLPPDHKEKARAHLTTLAKSLAQAGNYSEALLIGMVDREPTVIETDSAEAQYRFMLKENHALWEKHPEQFGGRAAPQELREVKKGLSEKSLGEVLVLSADEAYRADLASGIARNTDDLLAAAGLQPAMVLDAAPGATEKVARFLGNPILKILLIIAGLVGLFWELKAPGHGVGYAFFALCLGAFFWLQFLADNAGWLELSLFLLGMALLAVEIFIIPGFGLAGFSGFACVIFSIIFAFLPESVGLAGLWSDDLSPADRTRVQNGAVYGATAIIGAVGTIIAAMLMGVRLPGFRRLALLAQIGGEQTTGETGDDLRRAVERERAERQRESEEVLAREARQAADEAEAAEAARENPAKPKADSSLSELVGKIGTAETTLHPAGRVRLDGRRYDARTEGDFVEKGKPVRVLRVEAFGLVVREVSA